MTKDTLEFDIVLFLDIKWPPCRQMSGVMLEISRSETRLLLLSLDTPLLQQKVYDPSWRIFVLFVCPSHLLHDEHRCPFIGESSLSETYEALVLIDEISLFF